MAAVGSRVHALAHAIPHNHNYAGMAYSFPANSSQSQSHGGGGGGCGSSPSSAATTAATAANKRPTAAQQLLDDVDLTSQSALDFSEYLLFDHPEFAAPPQSSTTAAMAPSAAFGGLEAVAMATPPAHDPVHDQFQFQSGGFNPPPPPPPNLTVNSEIVAGSGSNQMGGTSRIAFRMKSVAEVLDDGFKWRKYGKKSVKNSPNPRNYYRCSTEGCSVKKRVERDKDDPSYVITTYDGAHNHMSPGVVYYTTQDSVSGRFYVAGVQMPPTTTTTPSTSS
ncbi:probable WRKY transcription factor 50 [Zingiber officinale]|uniref:WRKY domain-containing protein n=1 Tax=Zingiber officinale TaxID=94328 RepID=A0A8J5GWD1_ZINOF|nr:probable WRKY transcription factor 50 [Zingiber officinale]KAG6511176.1 hypothetical protein ZIOFF_029231 [Zingiber officinale]